MRVLILSCGTGGGHNAAASAMKEALEARGHSADVLNPYTLKTNKLAKIIDVVYVRLVQISPTLFGCVYKIGDAYRRLPWRSPVYFVNAQMVPVMDKYLKENKYDAILMPHLFPAEMVTQMKAKGINLPPTIFVATDYVCTPFTEETNCDAYVIPSRHVRYDFLRRGIPEEKIKSLESDKESVLEREANAKAGFVYIISNIGSFGEDIYKIGMTRRLEPMDRIHELSSASVPFEFDVHAMIFSSNAPELEATLHKYFEDKAVNKVNPRKEFYKVSIEQIEEVVKKNYNDTVQFTKIPLATEYRQSTNML